ncbi:trypsin-1-like isoform X3 [Colletes latitarsis]|uniref:trypsin-1-like isoform X3 n=1 Tax=Colletes latitarsis TaxID=2605962 RepID=UPI004036FE4C
MLPLVFLLASLAFASCYEPRIIGGSETTIDKYPYQVSIHYNSVFKCGGSIISRNWVLTAAHCVYGENPTLFQIRIQSTYSNKGGTLITGIKNTIYHELYDNESLEYDVALIQLPSPIKESANAKSIALPPPGATVMTGSKALVTGWGLTTAGGSMSNTLKVLTAPVVDQDTCKKIYGTITSRMICAGYVNDGGVDACQGDSGGPLVQYDRLIGIVSWGIGCARPSFPGVYSRVTILRNWITEKTGL